MSVSTDDLQMDLGCLSKTVPERMTNTDFGYGDIYERLAVAASQRKAIQAYCENCVADGCKARSTNRVCSPYPGTMLFEPTSASLVGLFTYGMAGRIRSPVMDASTGKINYLNLLENSIGHIEFCTFFSDFSQSERVKAMISQFQIDPQDLYLFEFYSFTFEDILWKEMKDKEIPCTSQRKLRSTQIQNLQDIEPKSTASKRHHLHADFAELQRLSGKRNNQVIHSVHHLMRPF